MLLFAAARPNSVNRGSLGGRTAPPRLERGEWKELMFVDGLGWRLGGAII